MGAATSPLAYAQDPPQVQRLHRKAVPQPSASPQSTDGGDEGVAALQVRRITRVPREDDGGGVELRGSAMDTRTLPTGFNRPLKPGQAQAERDGAVAADPGQPEGDAMETATENDAEAASEETGQLIAVAIAAAQVSAASQGRVLARSAVKTPTLPKHFVFRAPVRNRKITSRYGMRHHPMDRKKKRRGRKRRKKMHKGIDYGAPKGTPILATGPGEVIHAGWGPRGEGKCVFIKHPNGWMSLYLHMSTIDVEVGEIVKSRKRIGRVGSTGRSTGPHLHFQVQKNGRTVDPEQLLGKRSDRVKSP